MFFQNFGFVSLLVLHPLSVCPVISKILKDLHGRWRFLAFGKEGETSILLPGFPETHPCFRQLQEHRR